MRLFYLTSLYSTYLRSFYGKRPGLENASYAEQRAALDEDAFAWNGGWTTPMANAGHEFMEAAANADPAQRRWAQEQGVRLPSHGWRAAIVAAQIKAFAPDVLLADDVRNFSAEWYAQLRRDVPSLRVVIGLLTSPTYDASSLAACDVVMCLLRSDVARIRSQGGRALFFRHAFNAELVSRLQPRQASLSTISFCGSIFRGAGWHFERERILEHLVDSGINLEIHSPGAELTRFADIGSTTARQLLFDSFAMLRRMGVSFSTLRKVPGIGKAASWQERPVTQFSPRLRPSMQDAKYGIDLLHTMRASAVTVNVHGEVAGDEAVNVRLFEATGAGTCLLTDHKSDIAEIFTPDSEVVTFSSPDECVERARWLLDHPAECEAIARAGQARTLRDHTLSHRVGDIEAAVDMVLRRT